MKLITAPPHMLRIQKGIFLGWLFLATAGCLYAAAGTLISDQPLLAKAADTFIIAAFCFSAWTLYRFTTGELADRVFDNEDHLIVRKGKTQVTVRFSEIASVERRIGSKVLIRLSQPNELGNRIVFYPSFRTAQDSLASTIAVLRKRVEGQRRQIQEQRNVPNNALITT